MLEFILWMYFWANILTIIINSKEEAEDYETSIWDFLILLIMGSIIYIIN